MSDETQDIIISRKDAKAAGLKTYFTGKPCKNGHTTHRSTSNSACHACRKIFMAAWIARNPGKRAESHRRWVSKRAGYHKAWYAKNAAQRCAEGREYRKRNAELVNQRAKERRAADPERARAMARARYPRWREWHSQWKKENREKCREYQRAYHERNPQMKNSRRRARLNGAEGSYTAADIKRITKAQGGKCAYCRKRRKLTVDHIQALSKGGTNWPSNIQMLCGPCNCAKHVRDPIEFMQSKGRLL